MTTEDFISRAISIHGEKYDYSKVEYVNALTKVTIICPIHGAFEQRPVNHLRGHGCPYCGGSAKHTTEQFIESARNIHGNKYDYSQVEYVTNKTLVKIICPIHGVFEQKPEIHLNGCGCPYCGGSMKHTTESFIAAAIKVHGNKYNYSKVDYVNNKTKVTIICPIHGEFQQLPSEHLKGTGCQQCANNIKHTTEEFIAAARRVHGNKYDYSKVDYVNSKTKVTIICPIHGEFKQTPNSHLSKGCGCPYCRGSVKYTTETFIASARRVHGNKYDYSKVDYVNSKTKVTIICPTHGAFEQIPAHHLNGQGCPKCTKNRKYTTKTFIEAAREVHGEKYDYSKVKYVDSQTYITIICPIHGEFEQTPASHLAGHGCPYCGGSARLTTEQFIKIAHKIHGNKYDYSKAEYINMATNVTIICPIHGEFEQIPHGHLRGQGCPICKSSKLVEDVIQKLKQKNIQYTVEQTFEWLIHKSYMRLDIYLPKYNVAIECHGIQHFYPIEFFGGEEQLKDNQNRDRNKHDLCEANGVKIFYYSKHEIDDYELGRVYNDIDELLNVIINEA